MHMYSFSHIPGKWSQAPDTVLIENYKKLFDQSCFSELFHRYCGLVYAMCLNYLKNEDDCEDAVMEIFARIAEDLKSHEVLNFKSWLYSVAKHHCLMKKRRYAIHNSIFQDTSSIEPVDEENADVDILEQFDEKLLEREFETALNQLDPKQKICLRLFYFEKKSYHDIAEITTFDIKQVKSHLQNGKRNLKKILLQRKVLDDVR